MSDEPRFPPPHGQVGYRDAASAVEEDQLEPPVPSSSALPRGKAVIATRPDDPEVARAKAAYPPKRSVPAQVSSLGAVFVILIVVLWLAANFATCSPHHRHAPLPHQPTQQ